MPESHSTRIRQFRLFFPEKGGFRVQEFPYPEERRKAIFFARPGSGNSKGLASLETRPEEYLQRQSSFCAKKGRIKAECREA